MAGIEKDKKILICIPVNALEDPVSDSLKEHCFNCGELVWVSRASRKLEAWPTCVKCVEEMLDNDPNPQFGGLSQDQIIEILAELERRDDG